MTTPELLHSSAEGDAQRRRWMAMFWLCSAASIAYLQRNCLGVAVSTLRHELVLSEIQMGWILGGFFWTYAIFQIPSGWLADRWGVRKSLALYSGLWSVATSLMVFAGLGILSANSWSVELFGGTMSFALIWLVSMRLLGGAAQAGVFPCAAIVLANEIPAKRRGVATAALGAFQQVGAVIALVATGRLLLEIGWRATLCLYAVPGLIWSVCFLWSFHPQPISNGGEGSDPAAETGEHVTEMGPPPISWSRMAKSGAMWCICGQQFFRAAGYIFYATWFPTFLQKTRDVSVEKSGYLTAMTIVGALAGSMMGGAVSDAILARTGNRRLARQGVAVVGMLLCAACIFLAYFVENTNLAVSIISAGSFCASLAGPSAYTATIDMGGRQVATVFATMNMAGNIGAAISPIVVPYLVELPGGWDLVLFLFGGIYIVAAVFWMLLNTDETLFES